jgi:hypothetical protein
MEPDDAALDRLILASARPRALKVARIVVDVLDRLGPADGADIDLLVTRIVSRVATLVAAGELTGYGDLTKPRYSEVSLPA